MFSKPEHKYNIDFSWTKMHLLTSVSVGLGNNAFGYFGLKSAPSRINSHLSQIEEPHPGYLFPSVWPL
jgi:hypothetical protein